MARPLPKIINDPVHGFIEIPRGLMLDLIDHPLFQRLRRIKQLGMSHLVYPGAVHTRFHHALGAMHLTRQALDSLQRKGVEITEEECQATLIAILLHDLGHGPFSHSLEQSIIPGLHHEAMSLALMRHLNQQFGGELEMAIKVFEGKYEKQFLHDLVSSQLDMDRMDYLIRDSFFTGVAEGVVGLDRIIKTLNVRKGRIVVEQKGIYSVEKFVVARRLMYWQVYLHKAALSADFMLMNLLRRVRELDERGERVFMDEMLAFFLRNPIRPDQLTEEVILRYAQLDDTNLEFAIKQWQFHDDRVVSELSKRILCRRLLKIKLKNRPIGRKKLEKLCARVSGELDFDAETCGYFVFAGTVTNTAYLDNSPEPITIHQKNGKLKDLAQASDMDNILALSEPVVKHYVCWPEPMR